ncbi:MAG: arsenosugar biosynthesis radical SAM (seleno)protein ArsS [Pseudomonadota bacterium]
MHATYPLLKITDFPRLQRTRLQTLQVNIGYFCNQSCLHCHVAASPRRKEMMDSETAQVLIKFMQQYPLQTLDLTGGAPELHEQFKPLLEAGRALGMRVIDRCNLTVLEEPGQEDLAEYLAENGADIVASLPCYIEENVNSQRGGDWVFASSIRGLQKLNSLGYGIEGSGLNIDLVFNPMGPELPPPQSALEVDYKSYLGEHYGVQFNNLLTLANLPINRFGSTLISRGQFADYMNLLKSSHSENNLDTVMCRSTLSVDYQGNVYDCDFNQQLGMPLGGRPRHISEITAEMLEDMPIKIGDHCYGCTAGQGSSCGGALNA